MSCASGRSGLDDPERYILLKNLEKVFRELKRKEKGSGINENDWKIQDHNIFKALQRLIEYCKPASDFDVISREQLQNMKSDINNTRDQNKSLQSELEKEKKEKERYRREKNSLQEKASKLEEEVKRLEETIQNDRHKVIQREEEIRNLRSQVENLKEIRKGLENEEKRMQTQIAEKEETEKMLGMECLRLQETVERVKCQGEVKVKELTVQIEELEKNKKDLENKLTRYQENVKQLTRDLMTEKGTNKRQEAEISNLYANLKEKEMTIEAMHYQASSQIDKLSKNLDEERKAKENALNRLSAAAANRLRDQNPGITDLSDPNRPLKLAEKVSELYDNEWTNAIENLEAIDVPEEKGIRILLKIIQNVFDTCSEFGDAHLQSFPDLLVLPPTIFHLEKERMISIEKMSSDVLKPMKDFRKSNAKHAITCMLEYFSSEEGKSKMQIKDKHLDQCREYIDKCVELCWMMRVQDPPIFMEANYTTNSAFDSSRMRSFTKAGQFIHFVVWPTFFLHKDGPLLAKGVVQGSKTRITQEEPGSSSSDEESHSSTTDESDGEAYDDARSKTESELAAEKDKDGARDEIHTNANDNEPMASTNESSNGSNEQGDNDSANPKNDDVMGRDTENNAAVDGSPPNEDVAQYDDDKEEENTNIPSPEEQNETTEETPENRNQLGQMKAAGDMVETAFSHVPFADNVSTDQSDENTDDVNNYGDTEETQPEGNDVENPEKPVPNNQETDL